MGRGDSLGAGRTGGLAFVGVEGGLSDSLSEETTKGSKELCWRVRREWDCGRELRLLVTSACEGRLEGLGGEP
jgi:hypothetical protein